MPAYIQPDTIKKIENIIKTHKEISKSELITESKVNGQHLDKILKLLDDRGIIIIAKFETFNGDKVVTQAFDIKWVNRSIRKKKE